MMKNIPVNIFENILTNKNQWIFPARYLLPLWVLLPLWGLLLWSCSLHAAENIALNGLFKNKAVLSINGKTQVLTVGQISPDGITLVAIQDDAATLLVNGTKKIITLGGSDAISTQYAESVSKEVIISANSNGQFLTVGAINKHPATLLIDTGATSVALNSTQATKMGIDYKKGVQTMVSTASGMSAAYQVNIDTISVGDIKLHNIEAVVIKGNFPIHILLGMSFLGNVETNRLGNTMTIRKKW